ncbi:hypothetical protein [Wenjunlia tyrosinilytica]|uniref:Uncharacterized protein n=1 Tax=Wenjunlia tyrosinilytica TaxID=1544741 RepID=A0A917ZTK5_9ACTN|nr:hypothetical protein [Wenjunlia tyrosinilytica]GGO93264.1 hypothetical protein GCM10012280_45390 [Wenjunlia tyrosinilytica]
MLLYSVLVTLVAGAVISIPRAPTDTEEDDRVRRGRICLSALAPGPELTCGDHGFGDLRYLCRTRADGGQCSRTKAVTVRNRGQSVVHVRAISGPRQGVREQGDDRAIIPGHAVTLRRSGPGYLFDITLRNAGPAPAVLEVVHVE